MINGSDIIGKASTFFVNTHIGPISVSYSNSTVPLREIQSIRMSEEQAWNILKNHYPKEYKSYLKGEIYPITTGGSIVWKLKFINEKFAGKEIFQER